MFSLCKTYENSFDKEYQRLQKETNLKISTMTVVVELDTEVNFKELNDTSLPEFFQDYDAECIRPKGKKTGDEFMNQMTIRYKDEMGKKNIKVFPNGKLHMTGIKNMKNVTCIVTNICDYLSCSNVTNIQICLINSNFNLQIGVHLKKLANILLNVNDDKLYLPFSFYDPNKYPGIRMKYNNTSILLFASGSVMIAGAKNISDIIICYKFIREIVDHHYKEINCPVLKKK